MKKLTYKILSDNRTLIMGIAIIAIILFHYTKDCFNFDYNYFGLTKIYKTYIGSVGVDIFLLVSGLGLYYSFKRNSKLKEFFYKRYTRVLIPYVLVAIPSYMYLVINNHYSVFSFFKDITFINLFHHHDTWFWYIFFISFCYLIFPVIFKFIDSSKNSNEVSNKIFNLCISITMLCLLLFLFKKDLYRDYNIMLLRFLPFFLGILLGYYSYHKKKFEYGDFLLIGLGLLFVFLANIPNGIISRYSSFFFATSFLFIILFIIEKYFNKYKWFGYIRKFIEWFGKYSLEIYLIHVSIRAIFNDIGLYGCRIRYFVLYIFITLLLVPLLNKLVGLIQRLFDKKIKPLVN